MAWAASPRMTTEDLKWYGVHLMDIKGRCGFELNWFRRACGVMRSGKTPGKFLMKKVSSVVGLEERWVKREGGANKVQVNDLSREGIAINMNEPPGQMCR